MASPQQHLERGTAPRVSVIVAVYNGAVTVSRALQSVFDQTLGDFEIVVVNDGSTDDTPAVLAGYGDLIRVVTQANRGLPAARNAAIAQSRGEYVAFIDDDDEWMPDKLSRTVPILDQDPNCALVYTGALRVDMNGRPMVNQDERASGIESPTMEQMLARPWVVVPSQIMVRRSVIDRVGGFDERCVICCEDVLFLLRARECGYFRDVPDLLVRKATRPLYPKALKREPGCDLLVQLVRERYGASSAGFIREYRAERAKVMWHMARVLINEGRPDDARRCLARVIRYRPASPKAYRRYLRTFLPMRSRCAASNTEDNEA